MMKEQQQALTVTGFIFVRILAGSFAWLARDRVRASVE